MIAGLFSTFVWRSTVERRCCSVAVWEGMLLLAAAADWNVDWARCGSTAILLASPPRLQRGAA